jgi:hypothetical protein
MLIVEGTHVAPAHGDWKGARKGAILWIACCARSRRSLPNFIAPLTLPLMLKLL